MGPDAQNWKSGLHIVRFDFRGSSAVAPHHLGPTTHNNVSNWFVSVCLCCGYCCGSSAVVFPGTSAVLPRFFRSAVGIAFVARWVGVRGFPARGYFIPGRDGRGTGGRE